MKSAHSFWRAVSLSCIAIGMTRGAFAQRLPRRIAQTLPDGTLPSNSIVTPDGNTLTIDGGTAAGGNLFHSFTDFNVPTNDIAHFNNALTIDNIITRVTGGNISNIDGIIRANGMANLFIVNPAGLVFGPNASLDIGGSFVGSTAEALQFEDGSLYSAVDVDAPPLLTINVPVGLQFGAQPGGIEVEGSGHNLRLQTQPATPSVDILFREERPPGLQVQPDRTLALVGGQIDLMGGNLTAESGRIELGSVAGNSTVTLTQIDTLAPEAGWQLEYEGVGEFGDLRLSGAASIDTSGPGAGAVQVRGRSLLMSGGSAIVALTLGDEAGEGVNIHTTELVEFIGTTPNGKIQSGILADVEWSATGDGSQVRIQTERFLAEDGGLVSVSTRGGGNAGDLVLSAADITLTGQRVTKLPDGMDIDASALLSEVLPGSTGNSGNITIQTERLRVSDRASISTSTLGEGHAGNLTIRADESIEVSNVANLRTLVGQNAKGDGGRLSLDTERLTVAEGANIATTTLGFGNAGDLVVNASEILLSGERVITTTKGRQLLRASRLEGAVGPEAVGNAGNLNVRANHLSIFDRARISITLNGRGNFGNITLNVPDIRLRNGSEITAQAGKNSDGGKITLAAETLLLLEESLINANASEGRGGDVTITARGIFTDRNSSITASSQLGIDGRIILNTPDVDPGSEVLVGSVTPIDINALIDRNPCRYGQESQFTIPGRGGLPPTPQDPLWGEDGFVVPVKVETSVDRTVSDPIPEPQPTRLIEAQGWIIGDNGEVILTANPPKVTPQGKSSVAPNLTCQ